MWPVRVLEPFERGANGENPFAIQYDLQVTMQNLVGIVRLQDEMEKATVEIDRLKQRALKAGITGNREYNTGWHTALDLDHLLTIAEIVARAGAERKDARRPFSRTIIRKKIRNGAPSTSGSISRRMAA